MRIRGAGDSRFARRLHRTRQSGLRVDPAARPDECGRDPRCDVYDYPIERAKDFLKSEGCPEPAVYTGSNEAWKGICERDDLDLIYVLTPTFYHAEMAVHVLTSGKHAAVEVSAAQRVDDCWRLVDASERTRRHCVMLENCVYDFFESMAINMAHQGVFGEIIHAEGALYQPERPLFEEPKPPRSKAVGPWYGFRFWQWRGTGFRRTEPRDLPGAKIGRGDRLDYLTSMETDDFIRENRQRSRRLGKRLSPAVQEQAARRKRQRR